MFYLQQLLPDLLLALASYLLGAVSSAKCISRLLQLPDPAREGSKNLGATNMLRVAGKLPAILTLIGDVAKGVIIAIVAKYYASSQIALVSIIFVGLLGHIFPIYYRFRGGRGVAIACGFLLILSPILAGIAVGFWLLVFLAFRISSLAAILSCVATMVACFWLLEKPDNYLIVAVAITIIIKHKDNILRLLTGKERRI